MNIKKIIAREGLIILSLATSGVVIGFLLSRFNADLGFAIGYIIVVFCYPLYLIIRFILWAIKALREK